MQEQRECSRYLSIFGHPTYEFFSYIWETPNQVSVDGPHNSLSVTQPKNPYIHYPTILVVAALLYGLRLTTQTPTQGFKLGDNGVSEGINGESILGTGGN